MSEILNDFYVYLIYDPRQPSEPFYAGKGRGKRMQEHLESNRRDRLKLPVQCKIYSLLSSGFQPKFEKQEENLSEEEAFASEKQLIRFYGRRNLGTGCLLNMTDGGEGHSGYKCTEELRQKRRKRMMGNKIGVGGKSRTGLIDSRRIPVVGLLGGVIVVRLEFLNQAESQGYKSSCICNCLSGKQKTHGDLIWEKA